MKGKFDTKDWNIDVQPTKLAFIGAGIHATNMLFPSLGYLQSVERIAVCDLDIDRAEKVRKQFGFERAYSDYFKMFDKEDLDGVVVCVNAKIHPKIVKDAMNAGLDVFVEKPATVTPEECKDLWEMACDLKRVVMVDHQKRGSIAYRKAMDIVKEPDFGEVMMIESKSHGYPYATFLTAMMEWHIHVIDIFRAFGGDIGEVKVLGNKRGIDRSPVGLICNFESGVLGVAAWGTEGNRGCHSEKLEVVAHRNAVMVENARKVTYYEDNNSQSWESDWVPLSVNMTHVLDGYVPNLKTFCDSIHSREVPHPSLYDEWKNIELIYEICDQLGFEKKWKIVIGER